MVHIEYIRNKTCDAVPSPTGASTPRCPVCESSHYPVGDKPQPVTEIRRQERRDERWDDREINGGQQMRTRTIQLPLQQPNDRKWNYLKSCRHVTSLTGDGCRRERRRRRRIRYEAGRSAEMSNKQSLEQMLSVCNCPAAPPPPAEQITS